MADSDALWLALVGVLVYLVYGDHLIHAAGLYYRERSIRAFRNLFIAVMLQISFFRIAVGSMVRATPHNTSLELIQDVTAPIISLLILSGGFVLAWSWRHR